MKRRERSIGIVAYGNFILTTAAAYVPKIGADNQPFQDRGGQDAEVAKPRIETDRQAMDRTIWLVEIT